MKKDEFCIKSLNLRDDILDLCREKYNNDAEILIGSVNMIMQFYLYNSDDALKYLDLIYNRLKDGIDNQLNMQKALEERRKKIFGSRYEPMFDTDEHMKQRKEIGELFHD